MCLLTLHTEPSLILSLDDENQWLYAEWQEYQNAQTVQAGCQLILYYLQEYKCHKLLNDNTCVKGTWAPVLQWVSSDFFAQLVAAGITSIAWIHSPNCFSRYTTDYVLQQVGCPLTAAFNDLPGAYSWLQHRTISSYSRAS